MSYPGRMITFNGKTQNITEWSRELKLSRQCLLYRLASGWTLEDTLGKPVETRKKKAIRPAKSLTYNGKTRTILQWAEQYGISAQLIRYRLASGWSVEDALGKPICSRGRRKSIKKMTTAMQQDYVRHMMTLHNQMRATFDQFIRSQDLQNRKLADQFLRNVQEQMLSASKDAPGVVTDLLENVPDRSFPTAQETT